MWYLWKDKRRVKGCFGKFSEVCDAVRNDSEILDVIEVYPTKELAADESNIEIQMICTSELGWKVIDSSREMIPTL